MKQLVVGEGYNQVVQNKDPTCHAEMQSIQVASQTLNSFDLSGCVMYTSCEPCPMCLSATYWAKIGKIYYGSSHMDALEYGNFSDSNILSELQKKNEDRAIICEQYMQNEAVHVWREYQALPDKIRY